MSDSYQDHMRSPEFRKKRELICWLFQGICPGCSENSLPLEIHHNSGASYAAIPFERPNQIPPFCTLCHALLEWGKRHRAAILLMAKELQGRVNLLRVRLQDIDEFYRQHVKDLDARLDEIQEETGFLLAMSDA